MSWSLALCGLFLFGCGGEAAAPAGGDLSALTEGGTATDGGASGDAPGGDGGASGDAASGDGGAPSGFVTASGRNLFLDGKRFRFVGANRYDVASFPAGSGKFACGGAYTDAELDQLLAELVAATGTTVVRFWAFQTFTAQATDFSQIDRAIEAAHKHNLKLILTLENEWKDCTQADPASPDGRKSGAWFASGYRAPLGGDRLSFRDYAQAIVARYASEPAIAMWQLMNEAESTDGAALQGFTADMAQLVKSIDPHHLLSLGTIGGGQAGTTGAAYRQLHAVPGIDVVEAHDYHREGEAMPGAPAATTDCIFSDVNDALALGKPFFIGEAGIAAPSPTYPFSYAQRAVDMDAKIAAQWAAGAVGFLVWSWYDLKTAQPQGWDFNGSDPLAPVLAKHAAETP